VPVELPLGERPPVEDVVIAGPLEQAHRLALGMQHPSERIDGIDHFAQRATVVTVLEHSLGPRDELSGDAVADIEAGSDPNLRVGPRVLVGCEIDATPDEE
jgi:hypothetical protein